MIGIIDKKYYFEALDMNQLYDSILMFMKIRNDRYDSFFILSNAKKLIGLVQEDQILLNPNMYEETNYYIYCEKGVNDVKREYDVDTLPKNKEVTIEKDSDFYSLIFYQTCRRPRMLLD